MNTDQSERTVNPRGCCGLTEYLTWCILPNTPPPGMRGALTKLGSCLSRLFMRRTSRIRLLSDWKPDLGLTPRIGLLTLSRSYSTSYPGTRWAALCCRMVSRVVAWLLRTANVQTFLPAWPAYRTKHLEVDHSLYCSIMLKPVDMRVYYDLPHFLGLGLVMLVRSSSTTHAVVLLWASQCNSCTA